MASRCARIQNWMDDYRQGVLPQGHVNEFETHLADCPLCGALYEEQEAMRDLLRAVEPPSMPAERHLALLHRAIAERIASQGRIREALGRPFAAIKAWWYHPLSERTMATVGALAVLAIGLFIGKNFTTEAQTMTPQASMQTRSTETPAFNLASAPSTLAATDREQLINDIDLAVNTPTHNPVARPIVRPIDPAIRAVSPRPQTEVASNPFPPVYVLLDDNENAAPGSAWIQDVGLPRQLTDVQPLISPDELTRSIVATPTPGGSTLSATNARWGDDLSEQLQRIKLDLYLRGQNDLIPEIHALESTLGRMVGSGTGDVIQTAAQRDFTTAEDSLLRRDYHRAEAIFNQVAHEHSGTQIAALSWYHLGDIYYDIHADYAAARSCYQRAMASQHAEVFPDSVMTNMAHRLKILDDAAADDYAPLNILREAEAASAQDSLDRYRRLFLEYPGSEAAAVGISSLAERAMREIPDSPSLPIQAIDLLRVYQRQGGASHSALAQLRIADIVYHRLHNLPQALIEYGEVSVPPGDVALETMVRDRIAQILDNQVSGGSR